MRGGAVLQEVCRRWRSAVTLTESQMPLINSASQYLQDGPTCMLHLSMFSTERSCTSQANPRWGCTAKTSSPENLFRQLHSGHSQRNVSYWHIERCLVMKVAGDDQLDRACDCSSAARPQIMSLHLCLSFQCLGSMMCCPPGCYLMRISCVLTSR